jgi:hypothetical protein
MMFYVLWDMFWWTLCEVEFSWFVGKSMMNIMLFEHERLRKRWDEMICMCDNMDAEHK